jgi:hypothetical protein
VCIVKTQAEVLWSAYGPPVRTETRDLHHNSVCGEGFSLSEKSRAFAAQHRGEGLFVFAAE